MVLYEVRKKEIYSFYDNKKINSDNICEINDYIVDVCLKKENFEETIEEFYNITAMCSYMLEHNLYDEYFFSSFEELLDEVELVEKTEDLESDIIELKNYLNKDTMYLKYYELISDIINNIEDNKTIIINDNKIIKEKDNYVLYDINNERILFDDIEELLSALKINKDNYRKFNIEIKE
ncbi:MAG: hypothetical protein IKR57_05900 [Bacilli bacterium]|nr:hypothetical protein [Bacilli bacterium]